MDILLLGCGLWGQVILRDLVQLGARVSVVDPDAGSRQKALSLGAAQMSADTDSVSRKPDGVIVATPASRHAADVCGISTLGVPVFVEKPMATNLADAKRIVEIASAPVFVMHTWRYHPAVETMAGIVRNLEFGALLKIRSVRSNWTSPRTDVDPLWTLLPHDVSIVMELTGQAPTATWAKADWLAGNPVGLSARLVSGNTDISIEVSTREPRKHRELSLWFVGGVVSLPNDQEGVLELLRNEQPVVEIQRLHWEDAETALQRELKCFLDYLAGGLEPKCDSRTGLSVVASVAEMRKLAGIPS